jgi:hypothetical protein
MFYVLGMFIKPPYSVVILNFLNQTKRIEILLITFRKNINNNFGYTSISIPYFNVPDCIS